MGVWWVGRIIAEVCPCPMTFSQARAVELLLQLFCQKTPAIPLKPSIQHPPKAILWVGGWVGPINIMECPIDVELLLLLPSTAVAVASVRCVELGEVGFALTFCVALGLICAGFCKGFQNG